ncbi:hypothetical protein [Virgibacillus salexigens]|uniref:Uncharacterized protein n=1 Tax=Virgibacillus massiliensis TaxID=1462526 RepID=A0A024QI81_9BACI|nr:hypothetical protein [Virgibacillus massiliensis]CDQ41895.1 hypothetical protein BN990_04274 [Virgibacillus massiliensis]
MQGEDNFDFISEVLPEGNQQKQFENEETTTKVTEADYITTSYLLTNVIMNILIERGITTQKEINGILKEVHADFQDKRRGLS